MFIQERPLTFCKALRHRKLFSNIKRGFFFWCGGVFKSVTVKLKNKIYFK